MTARKAERLRWRKPPLPRAVRELLRDVVLYWGTSGDLDREGKMQPDQQVKRAARILGTTPAAIVARARKVRK